MTFDWLWSEQTQELNKKKHFRTAGSQWQNNLQKEFGWENAQSQTGNWWNVLSGGW